MNLEWNLKDVHLIYPKHANFLRDFTCSWFCDSSPKQNTNNSTLWFILSSRLIFLYIHRCMYSNDEEPKTPHMGGSQMVCQAVRLHRVRLAAMLWIRTAARHTSCLWQDVGFFFCVSFHVFMMFCSFHHVYGSNTIYIMIMDPFCFHRDTKHTNFHLEHNAQTS